MYSNPRKSPEDWTSFWDPRMGTCISFTPIMPVAESLDGNDAKKLKIVLNFDAAFPAEKFFLLETWIF